MFQIIPQLQHIQHNLLKTYYYQNPFLQTKSKLTIQQIDLYKNPTILSDYPKTLIILIKSLSIDPCNTKPMSSVIHRCFLSVYTLKSSISIGTVATLMIGISLLFVLVYAFIISSVTAQIQSDFRNLFIIVFFLSSIMMVVSSIAAIYGLIRKKNKYLVFYAITMGVYFISFLLLGIFSTDFPNQLISQCQKNPQSSTFQQAVNYANSTLCIKQCSCYFPNFFEYTKQQQSVIEKMGATFHSDNDSLPYNAENCPKWSNQTFQITPQLLMIETFFNCAGWCNVDSDYNLYYFFSNLKNGIPKKSCVDAFVQFFDKFGTILQVTSFISSAILFLILTNIFCLCFHPQRTQQYDALKFFRQTLVNKVEKDKQVSGTQIFKSKKSFDSIELGYKSLID